MSSVFLNCSTPYWHNWTIWPLCHRDPVSLLSSLRIAGMHSCTWLSPWVLGSKQRAHICPTKTLLSHLPSLIFWLLSYSHVIIFKVIHKILLLLDSILILTLITSHDHLKMKIYWNSSKNLTLGQTEGLLSLGKSFALRQTVQQEKLGPRRRQSMLDRTAWAALALPKPTSPDGRGVTEPLGLSSQWGNIK